MIRLLGLACLLPALATAQTAPATELERERREYADWLTTAPNSPLAAVAQQRVGGGLRLGPPDADVPLEGVDEHRVEERGGALSLTGAGGRRMLPRGRPMRLDRYTLTAGGRPGRSVLTIFREPVDSKRPVYYPYEESLVFRGPLHPPGRGGSVRVLAVDGIESEAREAGSVLVRFGGRPVRLRVRRIPNPGTEEADLEIYFRDQTNGSGTYPAGRFVALVPEADGRYRLDFNRARNPFCAYSTAYPCPAPWPGNTIPAPVEAGERYQGGGLELPELEGDA